jgi:hypothetical protein
VRAGIPVTSRRAEIAAAWDVAMRTGLPATFVCYSIGGVRHGHYVAGLRRFLPAVRPLAEDAIYDAARRRIAFVSTATVGDIEPDYVWVVAGIGVAGLGPEGSYEYAEFRDGEGLQAEHDLWTGIDPSEEIVRFYVYGSTPYVLGGRRPRESTDERPMTRRRDASPPAGITFRGNALVLADGTSIELGRGHAASPTHSFVPSADGRRLIVVSTRDHGMEAVEFEQYAAMHRTFVDHVDLDTRVVTRLGMFDGHPVAVEHDGDAYLSCSPRARRYPGFGTEPEELPEGLAPMPVFVAAQ